MFSCNLTYLVGHSAHLTLYIYGLWQISWCRPFEILLAVFFLSCCKFILFFHLNFILFLESLAAALLFLSNFFSLPLSPFFFVPILPISFPNPSCASIGMIFFVLIFFSFCFALSFGTPLMFGTRGNEDKIIKKGPCMFTWTLVRTPPEVFTALHSNNEFLQFDTGCFASKLIQIQRSPNLNTTSPIFIPFWWFPAAVSQYSLFPTCFCVNQRNEMGMSQGFKIFHKIKAFSARSAFSFSPSLKNCWAFSFVSVFFPILFSLTEHF